MAKQSKFDEWKELFTKGEYITERQVLAFRKMLNGYSSSSITKEEKDELQDLLYNRDNQLKITPEQSEKGINWLRNQWKTPRGVERKNNPFGYREEDCIENFDHFTFGGTYNDANYYMAQNGLANHLPLYVVHAKDGSSFEYYVSGGQVNITG